MTRAGHRSMQTTKGYLHLAGVVFRDEAAALERRMLGSSTPEPSQPQVDPSPGLLAPTSPSLPSTT
jgi:hypothetical protein